MALVLEAGRFKIKVSCFLNGNKEKSIYNVLPFTFTLTSPTSPTSPTFTPLLYRLYLLLFISCSSLALWLPLSLSLYSLLVHRWWWWRHHVNTILILYRHELGVAALVLLNL